MKKGIMMSVLVLAAGALMSVPPAFAQHVRDLTGQNLTATKLVQVLTPPGPRPRGIGLQPPECTHFRQQAARGIELAPKADIAAITVEFDVDSATLTPEAQKSLDTLDQALSSAELKPCCFEIEGFTDSTGSAALNNNLSEARAESVIDYLGKHGVERNRMMPKGFGEAKPVASNATETGREKNRRVQIVNLGYGTPAQ
ncbi:MAG: OmpA family protein [Candidatus Binataceae bacterium]